MKTERDWGWVVPVLLLAVIALTLAILNTKASAKTELQPATSVVVLPTAIVVELPSIPKVGELKKKIEIILIAPAKTEILDVKVNATSAKTSEIEISLPGTTTQVIPTVVVKIVVPAVLPKIPKNAAIVMPILITTIDEVWPSLPMRSFIASMIEQESCISLTHSKCWNSKAELKMSREYGFGFGQTTIAYRANGTERFNVWKELTALDPILKKNWTWENRYDPGMQLRAMLVKNRINYGAIKFKTANEIERLAFTAVWYNSGSPLIDRHLCVTTSGCDPSRWFGNVELQTRKSIIPVKGYGNSFAVISREYPRNVMNLRRAKYVPYLGS